MFYTEDMRRTDVNKRDFFHNVFKELCAPESQLFMYNDNQTMSWFPALVRQKLFSLGRAKNVNVTRLHTIHTCICILSAQCGEGEVLPVWDSGGLALNNNSVVNLPFPLALFKKLLMSKPSLEDLIEFSPVLGK